MLIGFQTHLKVSILLYLLMNTVKPNFTLQVSKALGFTRFLVAVAYLEKVVFFSDLAGFGGMRSTQPTKLTPMVYGAV